MTKEELIEYCDAEFKNIDRIKSELFAVFSPDKSEYPINERAALAAFLVNAYSGAENILKQILMFDNLDVKNSPEWHQELLRKAAELAILPKDLYQIFARYLAFRNLFIYTYIFDIKWEEISVLAKALSNVLVKFKSEVDEYIQTI
ncbi:MAG: hypothetical protein HY758_00080 [Nitrospirae bacterium]|nr:hypothetical protein [Nitrospirota bacterium]